MSLARDWIEAALNADLTQNELKAFLAIFHQTLCYGKTCDALTLKRVAQIAHVRADRLTPALRSIADKGLIEVDDHAVFGQAFSIPQPLLNQYPSGFFVPALPKNRSCHPQTRSDLPEKQDCITPIDLTARNPTTTPAPDHAASMQAELSYPADWHNAQRQRANAILDGLNPVDARDCLRLLCQALQTPQRVKSPLGFLYQLAQAARQGTLDRSALKPIPAPTPPPKPSHNARIAAIHAEITHIKHLYALADTALPLVEQRRLQQLTAELKGLA
jgi:hypothetical protein